MEKIMDSRSSEKSSGNREARIGDWEMAGSKEGRELGKRYLGYLEQKKKKTQNKQSYKKERIASSFKYC